MSEAPCTCVKCGGNMIKGFAADRSEHYYMPSKWVDGEPHHPTLLGIKGDNVKLDGSVTRSVRGLRCGKCGYLELYAV